MVNFAAKIYQLFFAMLYPTALRRLILVCLLGGLLGGCTGTSTNDESDAPTDSLAIKTPSPVDDINSNQSELLNTIVGTTEQGVIRGIGFGDPVSKVKSTEAFEMFEDSASHVGYTFETEQLETIDVLYYFTPTGRAVNRITVDVYLNSDPATRQLWETTRKRFTEKYGSPKDSKERQITWKKDPVRVMISNVSDGKDYGLKFVFEPTNKVLLAHQ